MSGREYRYVRSSNVQGVSYEPDSQTLHVQFTNGSEYAYHGVPASEYAELMDAPSPGGYLNDYIKGTYRYTRV